MPRYHETEEPAWYRVFLANRYSSMSALPPEAASSPMLVRTVATDPKQTKEIWTKLILYQSRNRVG